MLEKLLSFCFKLPTWGRKSSNFFTIGWQKKPIAPFCIVEERKVFFVIWVSRTSGSISERIPTTRACGEFRLRMFGCLEDHLSYCSKWLITMVSKSPSWGCSPSKWPFMASEWRLLTTYKSWDDPPSGGEAACFWCTSTQILCQVAYLINPSLFVYYILHVSILLYHLTNTSTRWSFLL